MTGTLHDLAGGMALAAMLWVVLAVIDLRREVATLAKEAATEAADRAAGKARRRARRAAKRASGPPVLRIVR